MALNLPSGDEEAVRLNGCCGFAAVAVALLSMGN